LAVFAKRPRPLSTERVTLNHELVLSNPKIQRLRRLVGRRSARLEEGVVVVEGEVLIREAHHAGWEIEAQFVATEVEPLDLPGQTFVMAPGVVDKVASTQNAQPHIAIFRQPVRSSELLRNATFMVVAHGVADPGNLGTMMRSAEASGADVFVVSPGTVDPTNPKVVRGSAGSYFRLPVLAVDSLQAIVRPGRSILATSSHQGVEYTEVQLDGDIALVFGNEAHGLKENGLIDQWVTIPQSGAAESLNVAMACTVVCFEVARQRRWPSGTVGER